MADACAHNKHFRCSLDLQGIDLDTLFAFTDEGRTMVSAIINGWVRMHDASTDNVSPMVLRNPPSSSLMAWASAFVPFQNTTKSSQDRGKYCPSSYHLYNDAFQLGLRIIESLEARCEGAFFVCDVMPRCLNHRLHR
jgi:hypothetical protein